MCVTKLIAREINWLSQKHCFPNRSCSVIKTCKSLAQGASEGVKMGQMLGLVSDPERERILEQLSRHNCWGLIVAPDKLKADRGFMMQAVSKFRGALQYASAELRSDRDFMMKAVSEHGYALMHASKELRSDRDFVMKAVSKNGDALGYASAELRSDRDLVLTAASNNWRALQHASEELRSDPGILASTAFGSPPKALVLKVTLLSGRSCTLAMGLIELIMSSCFGVLEEIARCLDLKRADTGELIIGTLITSDGTEVRSLDDLRPGMLNEVTLVIP